MGIIFRARGINSLGLLIIRLAAGAYFVGLGMIHFSHVEAYIKKISSFGIFSDNTAYILGFFEPIAMIVFGALLLLGFFTAPSSFILSIILIGKLLIGGAMPNPSSIPFSYNIILLACTLALLFAGAGVISFDALLDKRKKKVVVDKSVPVPPPVPVEDKKNIVTAEIIEEKKIEKKDDVKTEELKVKKDNHIEDTP